WHRLGPVSPGSLAHPPRRGASPLGCHGLPSDLAQCSLLTVRSARELAPFFRLKITLGRGLPLKPRPHLGYLSVHLSRPCWVGGRPLISMIGLSHEKIHFASTRLRCSSSRGLSSKASLSAHWWQGGHGGVWKGPSYSSSAAT